MAVLQRSEFALALNQIASERGVDASVILETMRSAILAAYRKDNPSEEEDIAYTIDLNENTGETRILKDGKDITPPGFGRIAAQTAKQVLLQKIREREKDAIIDEYSKRIGTVVNGMILRFAGPNIIVDIGKAEAILPANQRISNEQYFLNKKMPVYIMEISEEKGREVLVSRAHNGLIEGLLKREVPEVAAGSVVIDKIVREPGSRAKIAVSSKQSGVDPVGSCVGQKGVRIQSVIDALDGLEKIDVIQGSSDPAKFIANALSPAKELTVEVNEKEKIAYVSAPKEELPLIIGRDGQNVRLASKLAGYNIEVKDVSPVVEDVATQEDLPQGETQAEKLPQAAEKSESEENSSTIATSQEEKTEETA
ncbi:MAG TPA: transcription termination factor NusA [Candidatus Levybacteria bacterium]|nr:transcription termination factor NusA [Candidatus Levybacteria bacterium]